MATISKAIKSNIDDNICQGDIYKDVSYNYIDSEDDENVHVIELVFPMAIIISQACDVIAMGEMVRKKQGKATKFMPSVLMCPIYDAQMLKEATHLKKLLNIFDYQIEDGSVYDKRDAEIAKRDWHYRFHKLSVSVEEKVVLNDTFIDYKHYFTVSPKYLMNNISNRIFRLDDIYAEQITLKFATYLARVAIP